MYSSIATKQQPVRSCSVYFYEMNICMHILTGGTYPIGKFCPGSAPINCFVRLKPSNNNNISVGWIHIYGKVIPTLSFAQPLVG